MKAQELVDQGLVERKGDLLALSDHGREVGRLLATGRVGTQPEWVDEVLAPLLKRPSAG